MHLYFCYLSFRYFTCLFKVYSVEQPTIKMCNSFVSFLIILSDLGFSALSTSQQPLLKVR